MRFGCESIPETEMHVVGALELAKATLARAIYHSCSWLLRSYNSARASGYPLGAGENAHYSHDLTAQSIIAAPLLNIIDRNLPRLTKNRLKGGAYLTF
jgi:hypothetical protein